MSIATAPWAQQSPNASALCDERGVITWSQLDRVLNRATNALHDARMPTGRRLAIFAENSVETVMAHLAGILAGISTVPVNFHLTATELQYILTDSQAGALMVGPETAATGLEAARAAGVDLVIGWRCEARSGLTAWTDFLARAADIEPPTDRRPQPFLHYTSGTTGRPKGVETPPTMFLGGDSIAEHFDRVRNNPRLAERGVSMVVSPLYHTGPLGSVRSLAAGHSLVVLGRFNAESVLEAIDTHKVNSTLMVPTHFQRLLAVPEERRRGKIHVLSVAPLFAHAIQNVYNDDSVSELFDPEFQL